MQQFSGGCWCKFTFSREVQGSARDGVTVDVAERLRFLLKSHQVVYRCRVSEFEVVIETS